MNRLYIYIILFLTILSVKNCWAHDNIARLRIEYIDSLWKEDRYNEAIPLIHKALPLVIKSYGKESIEYFKFLSVASQIYSDADNDKQALILIEDVINGVKKNLGTDNLIYAKAISNKALFLINLGYAAKSIPLFGEAVQIYKLDSPSLDYATCLKDLAIAYYDTGQYEKAKSTLMQADRILSLSESTINDAEFVSIKNAIISFEDELGDSNLAITMSLELLNALKSSNLHIQQQSNLLLGLVCSYLAIDNYSKAIEEGLNLIKFNERNGLDSTKKDLGTIQYYIGLAYFFSKDFVKAYDFLLSSLSIREKTYGISHPYTIGVLSWIVRTCEKLHDEENLIIYLEQLSERAKTDFLEQFPRLDSEGQVNYWNELYSDFFMKTLPSLCHKFDNQKIWQLTYDGMLLSKGILLESDVRFRHELRNNADTSYFTLYSQIEEARKNNIEITDSLDLEEQKLRSEFIKHSNYLDVFKTSWKDIKIALANNEIAIEFIISPISESNDKLYSALLISNNWDFPQCINLFTDDDLKKIDVDEYYITEKLSNLIWNPILDFLEGFDVIYFSPIGELYNISIENLPLTSEFSVSDDSKKYMSDKYSLIRLNSTRDIRFKSIRNFIISASLFGDMNYNYGLTTFDGEISLSDHKRGNDLRSGFRLLPGTEVELKNINNTLETTGIDISTFSKNQGTKRAFMMMDGDSPSIIHIATHGFYNTYDIEIPVLDRSGLVLTGFNFFMGKADKTNDGCITASEISQLDFYNTDMAVLSACQTGLGKIEADGVYGLQRGFKMAGVNSLMMSLWEVDDDATQILMSEFYKNYVSGMSKLESLSLAQQIVRSTPGFENPEYWAAFILLDALN